MGNITKGETQESEKRGVIFLDSVSVSKHTSQWIYNDHINTMYIKDEKHFFFVLNN